MNPNPDMACQCFLAYLEGVTTLDNDISIRGLNELFSRLKRAGS